MRQKYIKFIIYTSIPNMIIKNYEMNGNKYDNNHL